MRLARHAPAIASSDPYQGCSKIYLLLSQRKHGILPVGNQNDGAMKQKTDVLQGTLALMVLKTLDVLGPQHGYGIARRIEQISGRGKDVSSCRSKRKIGNKRQQSSAGSSK